MLLSFQMTFLDYLKQQNLGHAGLKWKRISYVIVLGLLDLLYTHNPFEAAAVSLILIGLYYFHFINRQRK